MATTADFQKGVCIIFNKELYSLVSSQHVKPGKGGAFVRTKLKNLSNGRVIDHTFRSGAPIEMARIESHDYQYLYQDDVGYHFMHQKTYEQIMLNKDILTQAHLMKEGIEVIVMFHAEENKPLACELPAHIELAVTYTEPGIKGDTATTATKPATLETGAEIQVPLFVQQDEVIIIDTRTEKYVGRKQGGAHKGEPS